MKKICRQCGYVDVEDQHEKCPRCGRAYDDDQMDYEKGFDDQFQVLYGPGPFKDDLI